MQPRLSDPRKYYWGEVVEQYDDIRRPKERWRFDMTGLPVLLEGMKSVLDCPVGTGRFLPIYQKLGIEPQGVDVSADMVAKATANGFPNCQVGDAVALPLEDQSVDVVVCTRLMIHLQPEDAYPAIQEFKRVARRRVIIDARLGQVTQVPFRGTILHSRAEFMKQFESGGWKVWKSIGRPHYPLLAFDRGT